MAGDITGMMAQLNKAIGGYSGMADNAITDMSQGAGGLMGAATGQNSMDFMNEEAKKREGQKQLSSVDLRTAKGMADAARVYQALGDPEKAVLFATKSREMADAEAKNVTTHATQAALLKIVEKDNTLTQEQRDYYNAAIVNGDITTRMEYNTAKRGYATGNLHISGGNKYVQDSMGNKYSVTTVTNKDTGIPENRYSVLGTGPAEPVGPVMPISATTGLSGEDVHTNRLEALGYASTLRMTEDELQQFFKEKNIGLEEQSDIRKARAISSIDRQAAWATERDAQIMNIPEVRIATDSTKKALKLLDTQDTSGVIASIARIKDFLGIGNTASVAELNKAMSTYVLENLRKMGANPTEGERQFLIDAAANLGRGTEANIALFQKTLKRLEANGLASQFLLDNPNATRDEYINNYNNIIRQRIEQPTRKLGDRE